jgi:hypothetical protein
VAKSLPLPPKGSPGWAYRTLIWHRRALEQKQIAEGEYAKTLDELDRYEVWKVIPPEKPYGDRDAMLKGEIGQTGAEARQRVLGQHGDFPSVEAAAREAGIVGASFQIPDDPVKAAWRIVKHFQGDSLDALLAEIVRLRADVSESDT